jgi:chromosome segregation protein
VYLKSLKLAGFKSFADRTRLEFRPGVTVVVGPNGSGKSNIVDAVAWAMGSQSPKTLRTGRMEEVVFAGTSTRPPLNRAEVTLVLDNGDRMLPLDLAEVSITRRLYRDGSSDYEINGMPCRLLDIQELLSDSGIGRQQHALVGQGQIDAILNAGPDEQRAVVEEAAGILKHRLRREKALRRIEATEADLVRLNDLLGELNRSMRPLKRQAEAAAHHHEVVSEVHALTLFIAGEELRSIDGRRGRVEEDLVELRGRAGDIESEIAELNGVAHMLATEESRLSTDLDHDSAAAARLETTIERLRRVAQVAQERHRTRRARLEGEAERRRDLTEEASQLNELLAEATALEGAAAAVAEQEERAFRELEDEERSLADQESLSGEGAMAVMRGDLRALDAAEVRDRRELKALQQRVEVVVAQKAEEAAEIERVDREIRHLDSLTATAQERYRSATERRRADQLEWEEAEAVHTDARLVTVAAKARLEAVRAAEERADPEARRMVEQSAGALGSLGALLDLPPEWAAAVDAALGAYRDGVAFADERSLAEAVGRLKGSGRGGVSLVVRSPGANLPAHEVSKAAGVDALIDLLGPGSDRELGARLLGDVVVVEGWAAAWQLVGRNPWIRAVTPEGDLITVNGVRVAHPEGATPAMVETTAAAAEAAEIAEARAHSRLVSARRAFEQARNSERQALEALEEVEAQIAGATEAMARARRALTGLADEHDRLDQRRSALQTEALRRAEQASMLRERLAALEGDEARRQEAWDRITARRGEVAARKESARAAWQEGAERLSAATERRMLLDSRLAVVNEDLAREERRPPSTERLEQVEAIARHAIEVLRGHLQVLRDRQYGLRKRHDESRHQAEEVERLRHRLGEETKGIEARLSGLAVEAAELRVRRESVVEALRREVDADETTALVAPAPPLEAGIDARDRLNARTAELRRMGPVNPLAAEEYAGLSERHRFLSGQLADLQQSRAELSKVVKALDDEIAVRFSDAFSEIAYAYQENFAILFPGGRGRMRLIEPSQPLTTGVEIEAQPLGKKISRLSLLSGGERSLAALAFLFAVFKARPSPFYILDEVEAALDDANLRRFLRLVEAFRSHAQLIVVTHQQHTMEAADVLYGVTMEPGGSTKVVAKQLTQVGHKL